MTDIFITDKLEAYIKKRKEAAKNDPAIKKLSGKDKENRINEQYLYIPERFNGLEPFLAAVKRGELTQYEMMKFCCFSGKAFVADVIACFFESPYKGA